MREIKFRAWDNEEKEMLELVTVGCTRKDSWKPLYIKDNIINGLVHSNYDIMQYTGLKDKSGVEIYEGDIVKRTYIFDGAYGKTLTGEVVYDKEYVRYVISKPQKYIEHKTEGLRNVLSDKSTYEVIGNIWESPELLEVADTNGE